MNTGDLQRLMIVGILGFIAEMAMFCDMHLVHIEEAVKQQCTAPPK